MIHHQLQRFYGISKYRRYGIQLKK
jgi:hypothetical protein